jgi:hypothetical protein
MAVVGEAARLASRKGRKPGSLRHRPCDDCGPPRRGGRWGEAWAGCGSRHRCYGALPNGIAEEAAGPWSGRAVMPEELNAAPA